MRMHIGEIEMNQVHYTPGRVRFKFGELRSQRHLANAVEQSIRRLDGVSMVHVNTVTGSLLIHYDVRGEREEDLLHAIRDTNRRFGLPTHPIPKALHARPELARNKDIASLAETSVEKLMERAIEGVAMALLGPII